MGGAGVGVERLQLQRSVMTSGVDSMPAVILCELDKAGFFWGAGTSAKKVSLDLACRPGWGACS